MSEPHINPIMGIRGLCWASDPVLGIAAPYQPHICHWLPEPHIGYRSPVAISGYQSPMLGITDWTLLPHVRYHWPRIGHRHPFGPSRCPCHPLLASLGFCRTRLGLHQWNKKVPPTPQSHFPARGGDIASTLPGSRMGLCLKKGFFVCFH